MAESPAGKQTWSLKMKLLVWLVLPLMVLLAAALVLDGVCQGKLNAAMRQARAGGGPVTFEELQAARKAWPDEQNGALILVKLATQLDTIRQGPTSLPAFDSEESIPLGRKHGPEKLQVMERELERLAPELAEIDRLLHFEGGQFPLAPTSPLVNLLLTHLGHVRASARLKYDQALWRVMTGDTLRLVDDVAIMQRHGQLLADEPWLISALVRVACDALMLDTIERAVGLTTLAPEQLEGLEALLAGMEGQNRLWWGIRGERAFFVDAVEALRQGKAAGFGPGTGSLPRGVGRTPGLRGFFMQDLAAGLRFYNRLVAASKDSRQAARVSREIEQQVGQLRMYQPLTSTLMPSFSRAFDLNTRLEAQSRAARTGLAAERYRLDTGRFPPSLEALTPRYLQQVPLDPFDDQPLRYKLDEPGVVIYSVGEDLKDDGGLVSHRIPGKKTATDFGFVLLSPEQRGLPATQPASVPEADGPGPTAEALPVPP